jgi:peptidoglycan/xylan/chitin deacetylase (PgdA/CDA1 family)
MRKFMFLLFFATCFIWTTSCETAYSPKIAEVIEHEDLTSKVPIIMYHYVREVDFDRDPLGWNLSINPTDFEKQLAYLKTEGYSTVHLSDLIEWKVPEKSLVLSFDDGLEDFYTTALPLLNKYGFTASNSVITGMIGSFEHMNEEQIRSCIGSGIEITSHTVDHPDLSAINEDAVRYQVSASMEYLTSEFGIEVDAFVYPAGKYNDLVVGILNEEGYKIAVTTEYAEADLSKDEMLLLPRIRIDNRDGFDGFVRKIESLK